MNEKKKYETPLTLDMGFNEALGRFVQTDPNEMPSNDIVPHTHKGELIHQRSIDGFINATAMCKAYNKSWSNYFQNDSSQEFFDALERSLGIPRDLLIRIIKKGPNDQRGTWIHPQIAINLATWLNPDFAVQVSEWVINWMLGAAKKQSDYPDFESLSEDEKRLYLREQVRASNTILHETAKGAGVHTPKDFSIFNARGYQGMYEKKGVQAIRDHKGLPSKAAILDHMGSTELAANLFRITQTDEKLIKENISNKWDANEAHYEIGQKVRQAMIEMSGTPPEDLPVYPDVNKLDTPKRVDTRKITKASEGGSVKIDIKSELWKYALLVLVQQPDMEMSTSQLIKELPNYIAVPDEVNETNSSRNDSKFSQLVRNLKSHKNSKSNFIYQGYAEAIPRGFRATPKGRDFVMEYFKDRAS